MFSWIKGETFVLLRLDPLSEQQNDDDYTGVFEELLLLRAYCAETRVRAMLETCFRQQIKLWAATETLQDSRDDFDVRVARIKETVGGLVAEEFLEDTAATFWECEPHGPGWAVAKMNFDREKRGLPTRALITF